MRGRIKGAVTLLQGAVVLILALAVLPRFHHFTDVCRSYEGAAAQVHDTMYNLRCSSAETGLQFRPWIIAYGIFSVVGGLFFMAAGDDD